VQSERKGFVPCDHEDLNFKGKKLSKSRGAFVEVPYFLSKYDPDPLRFYLTASRSHSCKAHGERGPIVGLARTHHRAPSCDVRYNLG
jgi:leucyl-tRNA synthetase